MAINKVQLADGTVLMDITDDTVTVNSLLLGSTAHGANGESITGEFQPFDELDITIYPANWSDNQSWPENIVPMGESSQTCALAEIVAGTGVDYCHEGDGFAPSDHSEALCPSDLYVYIGDETVYVAAVTKPTQTIRICGTILHLSTFTPDTNIQPAAGEVF